MKRAGEILNDWLMGLEWWIFLPVVFLLGFGLSMVYSASAIYSDYLAGDTYRFISHQLVAILVGALLALFFYTVGHGFLSKPAVILILVSISLLSLVGVLLFGSEINGSRSWFTIWGYGIQPSEFAKLVLVITLAYIGARIRQSDDLPARNYLNVAMLLSGVIIILVALQNDLGSAAIVFFISFAILVSIGLPWRYIAAVIGIAGIAGIVIVLKIQRIAARLAAFIDPWQYPETRGFNIIQSYIAFGQGGILGAGAGNSKQKLFYLPHPHNDFIFSIIGEEWGFIGTIGVIIAIIIIVHKGMRVAGTCNNVFGAYLAFGITAMYGIQSLLNIAVSVGLVPVSGFPLPLVSYGGSSMVVTLSAFGILLGMARESRMEQVRSRNPIWKSIEKSLKNVT